MKNKTRNASLPLGSNGSAARRSTTGAPNNGSSSKRRYWHYVIFITLVASSFFNLNALWGLLFIGWTIPAYVNRSIFFIDMIHRDNEPIFYWSVFVVWIGLGVLMVLVDVPTLIGYFSS